jgi:Transposase DDE domain
MSLDLFLDRAPCCVLAHAVLEGVLEPALLDDLFEGAAERQYTRHLLFSQAVALMADVACRIQPSVYAAWRKAKGDRLVCVSAASLYDKLARVEAEVSCELVRHCSARCSAVLDLMPGSDRRPLLGGYEVRIIDGDHLAGTHKRLAVLRQLGGAALPGQSVCVLDPHRRLICDVAGSEDAHAQESTLLEPLLRAVKRGEVWVADRHYCISALLFALARRLAFFLIRQHEGHLRWQLLGKRHCRGRIATGVVYEQAVKLTDPDSGEEMTVRRVSVMLDRPTRDGETQIHLLSNVPATDATACELAELYQQRWQIEGAFREMTVDLRCEVQTLGYPKAALFSFSVAACCYNAWSLARGALRAAHGEQAEGQMSSYYVADEMSMTWRGMAVAVPDEQWQAYRQADAQALAVLLLGLARRVDPLKYKKHKTRPKKPKRARPKAPRKHSATARLLEPARFGRKKPP